MLKASELRESDVARKKRNREMYKSLLRKCTDKLRTQNERGFRSMIFKLNPINIGMPLYNVSHAMLYIMRQLNKGGFKVSVVETSTLYIDWSCA